MAEPRLGSPRVHLRLTGSTNAVARELAAAGAPHGTLVSATEQTAGRGRQGRAWVALPGRSLLCSWVIRDPSPLLSLAAGVAVAETIEAVLSEAAVKIKWPNDVLLEGRKLSGILVEGRPQERWAVLGIGLNVAIPQEDFPAELRERAGTLGLRSEDLDRVRDELQARLDHWVLAPDGEILDAMRRRDALYGRPVSWDGGAGTAAGVDQDGRLLVDTDGGRVALDAGEVHLSRS